MAKFFFHQVPIHGNCKKAFHAPGSAGYDLFAVDEGVIDPLNRKLIKLGFKSAFSPGYVGLLLDKSGMGNKGLTKLAGVIDANYRDEWGVILYNTTQLPFRYIPGDRLIQVVFFEFADAGDDHKFDPGMVLDETERKGGFGSTETTEELLKGIGRANLIAHLQNMNTEQKAIVHQWAQAVHRARTTGGPQPEVPELLKGLL